MRRAGTLGRARLRRRHAAAARAALLLCAGACSCSGGSEAGWTRLAADPGLDVRLASGPEAVAGPDGRAFRLLRAADSVWIETELARADWSLVERLGVWRVPLSVRGAGRPPDGAPPQRLTSVERAFTYSPPLGLRSSWELAPGGFYAARDALYLKLEPGAEPPARATLAVHAAAGPAQDGRLRVTGERFSGDGFALWPGDRASLTLAPRAGSVLRFAACLEPVAVAAGGAGATLLRVTFGGSTLHEEQVESASEPWSAWREVELEGADGAPRELAFEVEGALARAAFVAPVVGPVRTGGYGARPWGADRRRDVCVFLADTFRADGLQAYGGRLGLTPHLDRFGSEGVLFRRAWSVGTYTLPAHVSLFSGLFPLQAGTVGMGRMLPGELVTLAEHLSEQGYRTGAITDSVVVSQRFGLDQGFEWFDESHETLESTRERVRSFLDADDGRPVFLFVHSYRTHAPYHVSDATRERWGRRLGIEADYATLEREWQALRDPRGLDPARLQRRAWVIERLLALYRGGMVDLDLGFEELRQDLAQRGFLERGHLLFTSDHGEAFFEHDEIFHPGKVWEELARVPLIIGGGGLAPRTVEEVASLVDLAPTVAALAGLAPHPAWLGRPLLAQAQERPVFVFQCARSENATLAVIEGQRKVFAPEDPARVAAGEVLRAFDLAADPLERADEREAPWAGELLRRHGARAAELLRPVVGEQAAELDPAHLAELRAMGYAGD